jgi:translation initiation factor IF-3
VAARCCHHDARFLVQERALAIDRIQNRVNDQIRISPVRVISETGEQLGILSTADAISRAQEVGLDLVEVAPNEKPPVCRIMDFGKYKYEKKKRQSHNTHQIKTKEIRLRPKTGEHDVEFKIKQAVGFLQTSCMDVPSACGRGTERACTDIRSAADGFVTNE